MTENNGVIFQNIVYPAESINPILKSIDGRFPPGKLTGIVGKSGAGKTTLLNVLAGQISTNLEGNAMFNGIPISSKKFKNISSYLPQDVLLQPYLTVKECMSISASLMLNQDVSNLIKDEIVIKILKSLNMENLADARTEKLSGGEQKRLSIAIELINDPQIMLLDEPTSGLDNVSAKKCMEVLKSLTLKGKTIICSIHQPSDSIFQMFDHVYFVNDGSCIYNGIVENLTQFLENSGYQCPKMYNPADYILELDDLAYETLKKNTLVMWNEKFSTLGNYKNFTEEILEDKTEINTKTNSIYHQTKTLLKQNYIQLIRKKILVIKLIVILFSCLLFVSLTFDNGNRAEKSLVNFKVCFAFGCFFHFTFIIVPVLTVPATTKITKSEMRNGRYSPLPYLIAEILTLLPTVILFTTSFSFINYGFMFMEINIERILMFNTILMLTTFSTNIFGLSIGYLFNAKHGSLIAPAIGSVLGLLSIVRLGGGELNWVLRTIREFSFMKYCLVGIFLACYGGREKLECSEIFCPHSSVQRFFKDMGLQEEEYSYQVFILSIFSVGFIFVYYLALRIKFLSNMTMLLKRFRSV